MTRKHLLEKVLTLPSRTTKFPSILIPLAPILLLPSPTGLLEIVSPELAPLHHTSMSPKIPLQCPSNPWSDPSLPGALLGSCHTSPCLSTTAPNQDSSIQLQGALLSSQGRLVFPGPDQSCAHIQDQLWPKLTYHR